MDLRNLESFVTVAECNNFTKAAERLGYSQSTVSFQIKQLEKELGFPLFERINHSIALTDKGHEVLEYANKVHSITKEFELNIKKEKSLTGHIRMALADSLCSATMLDRFEHFRKIYPDITLKIVASGTENMFQMLDHNEVDLILTVDNHIYDSQYIIVKERTLAVNFVCNSADPIANKKNLKIEDFANQPLILTEKAMSYRALLDEMCARHKIEIKPILEIGDANLIAGFVERGIGLSFLPDFCTEQGVRNGKIKRLSVKEVSTSIWKQLIIHRDKWLSPQLKAVLDYMCENEF